MSGEKKVICASTEFRSVADPPKHIINVSASSWLLSGKGPTPLLLLVSSTNEFLRQKTRVPGLLRGVVCVIAVLIQYRRVTHRQTHRHAMMAIIAQSKNVAGKNGSRDPQNGHLGGVCHLEAKT